MLERNGVTVRRWRWWARKMRHMAVHLDVAIAFSVWQAVLVTERHGGVDDRGRERVRVMDVSRT